MDKSSISEAMADKISRFCDTITKSYDLDTDIREELCGHIEDRLLEYQDEHTTLSEEDAFVLVREHFGDPAEVRKLLGAVHGDQAKGSFLRRLAAVFAATIVLETVMLLSMGGIDLMATSIDHIFFGFVRDIFGQRFMPFFSLSFIVNTAGLLFAPLIFFFMIRHWQKRIDKGQDVWFRSLSLKKIIAIIILLFIVQSLSPTIVQLRDNTVFDALRNAPAKINKSAVPAHSYFDVFIKVMNVPGIALFLNLNRPIFWFPPAYYGLILFIWLWWCDTPRKRLKTLFITGGVWLAYMRIIPLFLPIPSFFWSEELKNIGMTVKFMFIEKLGYRPLDAILLFETAVFLYFLALSAIVMSVYLLLTRNRLLDTRMAQAMRMNKAEVSNG